MLLFILIGTNQNISVDVLSSTAGDEIKHISSTYADATAKIKEHEILQTVHYVVVFKGRMENNIDGLQF